MFSLQIAKQAFFFFDFWLFPSNTVMKNDHYASLLFCSLFYICVIPYSMMISTTSEFLSILLYTII